MRLYSSALAIAVTLLFSGARAAQAGPFAEFFRELRHALRNPEEQSGSHRTTTHKNETPSTTSDTGSTEGAKATGAPSEHNTRTTSRAKTTPSKGELKYGTPVPGRKGLVTSPFSPDAGYIDVRGFPPGTPVKDPYSGKIFLTP